MAAVLRQLLLLGLFPLVAPSFLPGASFFQYMFARGSRHERWDPVGAFTRLEGPPEGSFDEEEQRRLHVMTKRAVEVCKVTHKALKECV